MDLTQGMRNWLAYNLARASGRYASRTVWVEVFLVDDGVAALAPTHYHGIYIGLEKIKAVGAPRGRATSGGMCGAPPCSGSRGCAPSLCARRFRCHPCLHPFCAVSRPRQHHQADAARPERWLPVQVGIRCAAADRQLGALLCRQTVHCPARLRWVTAPTLLTRTLARPRHLACSYENDNLEAGDVHVGPLTNWQDPFLLL